MILTIPIPKELHSRDTNRLVTIWFLVGRFDDEPLSDLASVAKEKKGFSATLFLLPDTQDDLGTRQALEQAHHNGANLQLLVKDIQKHNKASSQVLCPDAIYH